MGHIVLLGTLDTKKDEIFFMKELIRESGHAPILMDVGPLGPPISAPDISNEEIARAAGWTLGDLARADGRDRVMKAMGEGAARCLLDRLKQGLLDGVLAIGGNQGTAIASMAMGVLPIGFPKFVVSTVASGNIRPFVGSKDLGMMFSVADLVGGPNPVSRSILSNAVGAVVGMVEHGARVALRPGERTIGVTALGNTEPAVAHATALLRGAGLQVVAFHASGAGGSAMEELVEEGIIDGVLDLTPHELIEEVVGAGAYVPVRPGRLKAAGVRGIPQVVSTGGLEYLCFGPFDSIPIRMRRRRIYMHNPLNANVKASRQEMAEVGRVMAARLNESLGPAAVVVPLHGWSIYGGPGGPLHDPAGNRAFLVALKRHLRPEIPLQEVEAHINEPRFVELCVERMLNSLAVRQEKSRPR
jgi:uncharacterized protein (UPF0261 family)